MVIVDSHRCGTEFFPPSETNTSSTFDLKNGSGEFSSTVMWRMAPGEGKLQGDGGRKKGHASIKKYTVVLLKQGRG